MPMLIESEDSVTTAAFATNVNKRARKEAAVSHPETVKSATGSTSFFGLWSKPAPSKPVTAPASSTPAKPLEGDWTI